MSLNFAAVSPHPPIILPEIGAKEDLIKAGATVQAMKRLGYLFKEAEIDTLLVISPHFLIYPDRFNLGAMKNLFGSMAAFDAPEVILEFKNDLALTDQIVKKFAAHNLPLLTYDNGGEFLEMDHGLMVPLYYLNAAAENGFKVVPMAYAGLKRSDHFSAGQILGEVLAQAPNRCGIVASGDLSHRLISGAPAANPNVGKEFDKKLVADLKKNRTQEIIYYDDDLVEEAGECGYRSILMLLGALDGKNAPCNILSYEGPFGVGYLVANLKLAG